ncbi:MAG: hypothetical protein OEM29_02125 [Thermoplasmata archaeon]|nr:hypothetical protein [Thermoplasmata archaeon]
MSARCSFNDRGQLALMDAMVFFAVAILISSLQLCMYRVEAVPDDVNANPASRCNPESILPVFLKASLGARCVVQLDRPLDVPAHTTVSECLAAEATAVLRGEPVDSFDSLNSMILGIATNISHPLMTPHVILHLHTIVGDAVILRIERSPPGSGDILSACCDLPEDGIQRVTISFQLEPAFLPEGFGI